MSILDKSLVVAGAVYGSFFYLFIFSPVLVLVLFSFQDGTLPMPPFHGFTLKWYGEALADGNKMDALVNSVFVGVTSSLASCGLGFFAAYGLARFKLRFAEALAWLLIAPATLSYLIIAMGLLVFFGQVGMPRSLLTVIIGHIVINLPIAFAILYSQIGSSQVNLENAARDLGAKEWQVLALVVLPAMAPAFIAAFALCFSLSWDEFIIAFLLSQFDATLPVEIWTSVRSGLNPVINATGTIVFGLSLGLFLLTVSVIAARKVSKYD
ncbi:MAG: ABC transporter permease [Pseudomonadota bacterium]